MRKLIALIWLFPAISFASFRSDTIIATSTIRNGWTATYKQELTYDSTSTSHDFYGYSSSFGGFYNNMGRIRAVRKGTNPGSQAPYGDFEFWGSNVNSLRKSLTLRTNDNAGSDFTNFMILGDGVGNGIYHQNQAIYADGDVNDSSITYNTSQNSWNVTATDFRLNNNRLCQENGVNCSTTSTYFVNVQTQTVQPEGFNISTGIVNILTVNTTAFFTNGSRVLLSSAAVLTASGTINASTINITRQGALRFTNTANTKQITMRALPGLSANTTYTWNSDGAASQLLTTNGSGNLTWSYGFPGTPVFIGYYEDTAETSTTNQGPGAGTWAVTTTCLSLVSITNSRNYKISVSGELSTASSNNAAYATLLIDGTDLSAGKGYVHCANQDGASSKMDCPASLTYYGNLSGDTVCVGVGNDDGATTVYWNTSTANQSVSTILVEEYTP